ncbi:hypothetical protein EVG20_g767 [Dentipellis fragilis]|uniref:DUF6533 domain-containing protein n=1 Tax=Dentipellis fragilis TaxID=205917 RepID=A0A4Y9ZBT0_9AGAM|nr:hypothetical protein EVG20_g767 [Dentipellis fragilis]
MADPLNDSIIALGHDIFVEKLYYVATCALWLYDYLLTMGDEVAYAWAGKKTYIFYLYLAVNHSSTSQNAEVHLSKESIPHTMCIVGDALFDIPEAYFLPAWTIDVYVFTLVRNVWSLTARQSCTRFCAALSFEAALTSSIAEIFLTLRVYAITGKRKLVLVASATLIFCQWGVLMYQASQSQKGTSDVAALLPLQDGHRSPLPALPDIDAFRMLTPPYFVVAWIDAFLVICLGFDAIVFLVICITTVIAIRRSNYGHMLRIVQRDGIVYFFVLFSSNLIWLLLALYAPPGRKYIQTQPALIISSIMINRITLNLKRGGRKQIINYGLSSDPEGDHTLPWSVKTFEDPDSHSGSFDRAEILEHELSDLRDLTRDTRHPMDHESGPPVLHIHP